MSWAYVDVPAKPTARHLPEIMLLKYGKLAQSGWGPRLRAKFGYYTPDDWYESVVFDSVKPETEWLDVGCGRDTFPSNRNLARLLAQRCRLLVGLDPSENVYENPFVHERIKDFIENYETDQRFDLITLRMVAEHIERPDRVVASLSRLAKPGALVVIYTVKKWAPVSIVASLTPMAVHHALKRVLWGAEERDTFPVVYKMNTRRALRDLFETAGFRDEGVYSLDDCRSFQRWKFLNMLELTVWRTLKAIRVGYPEACILAIYRKS